MLQNEPQKTASFGNQSFHALPNDFTPPPVNNGTPSPTSLLNLLGQLSAPNNNLISSAFPTHTFYHPSMKRQDNVAPSPMIQLGGLTAPYELNSAASNLLQLNQGFQKQNSCSFDRNEHYNSLNSSNSMINCSFVPDVAKYNQSIQPKFLAELLQKSCSSTHSTSFTQSQSPFLSTPSLGYNNPQASYQNQVGIDVSNFLTASLLETPSQNSRAFRTQPAYVQNQPNNNLNQEILFQLQNIVTSNSSGETLKLALAHLVRQYGSNNVQNNNQIRGNDYLQNQLPGLQNGNAVPKTIPLANGFIMNSVDRKSAINSLIPNNHLRHLARDPMSMAEASSRKNNCSIIVEEDSSLFGDLSTSNQKQPNSPNQSLNKELDTLSLNPSHKNKNGNIRSFITKFLSSPIETGHHISLARLLIGDDLKALFEERLPQEEPPGTYDREERTTKILKYKNKIRKWRIAHPVNRKFKGRSAVAVKKLRVKGKFVTTEEYEEYIKSTNVTKDNGENDPQYYDQFNEVTTCIGSERSAHRDDIKEETI